MKRRLFNWLSSILEWLLLLVDGHAPTQVRMKAVQVHHVRRRISRTRAQMSHHCDIPPWGSPGGSWYCPLCRTWRGYQLLPLPRTRATEPHYVARVRGRHNGHLRYTGGLVVDTGKLLVPGGRA